MTIYRSRIGPELAVPLTIFLGALALMFFFNERWAGMAIIIAVILFAWHMFLTTRYVVDPPALKIVSGFFYRITINISTITSITDVRNAMSSPAASLDRLQIRYNAFDEVLISPKQKEDFIHQLKQLNPAIKTL